MKFRFFHFVFIFLLLTGLQPTRIQANDPCPQSEALAIIEAARGSLQIHQIGYAIQLIDQGQTCEFISSYVANPGTQQHGATCLELYDGDPYYEVIPGGPDSGQDAVRLDNNSDWDDIVDAFASENMCYPDIKCTAADLVAPTLKSPADTSETSGNVTLRWEHSSDCVPEGLALSLNDGQGEGYFASAGLRGVTGGSYSASNLICNQTYVWWVFAIGEDNSIAQSPSWSFVPTSNCQEPETPAEESENTEPAPIIQGLHQDEFVVAVVDDTSNMVAYTESVILTSNLVASAVASGAEVLVADDIKDSDGDNVIDSQDECPTTAGVPENLGCEWNDEDGDGIGDWADLCWLVAGEQQYGGCPWDLADADGDGVRNDIDNCVQEWGDSADGCPDTDGDGIADWLDACPDELGAPGSEGCPWTDDDGDGLPPWVDQCPDEWGTDLGCPDTDGDGVADVWDVCPQIVGDDASGCPDSDGDGVHDGKDNCPNAKGIPQLFGCPAGGTITGNDLSAVEQPEENYLQSPESIVSEGFSMPCIDVEGMTWSVDNADGFIDIITEPNCGDGQYQVGTVIEVHAIPYGDNVLNSLSGCGIDTQHMSAVTTVTRSCAISAHFAPVRCTSINTNTTSNGGTGRVFASAAPDCPWSDQEFRHGTMVDFRALADSGEFSHWETDCFINNNAYAQADNDTIPIVSAHDCTVAAVFTDTVACYAVDTVIAGGDGTETIELIPSPNCNNNTGYSENTTVHLRTSKPVLSWAGDCGNDYSFVVSQDCTAIANFSELDDNSTHTGSQNCTGCHMSPGDYNGTTASLTLDSIPFDGTDDTDGDGIIDKDDDCPDVPGIRVLNGCPMSTTHISYDNNTQVSGYGNATSSIAPYSQSGIYTNALDDMDGDGILNGVDQCPDVPGDFANRGCPALSSEACIVTTASESITIRVGPGNHRGIFGYMPVTEDGIAVVGFAEADDGSLWWELNVNEISDSGAANSIWVNQADVTATGGCDAIVEADAPPVIYALPTAVPASGGNPDVSSQNTTVAGWGACGSCSTCSAGAAECRTNPSGECIWDPGGCGQQASGANTGTGGDGGVVTPEPVCYNIGVSVNRNGYTGNVNPAPHNCPNGPGYLEGSTVTFGTSNLGGGVFVGWSGCGAMGTNSVTFTVTGNCGLTANFDAY